MDINYQSMLPGIFSQGMENREGDFGTGTQEEIGQLIKALQAGESGTDISTYVGFQAAQVQSLEGTMALLTASLKDCVLYNDVPKTGAASTIEEWSSQLGYGREGGFVGQMELPLEDDPELKRNYATIKFLREMWKFSSVASMVTSINSAEMLAKQAALMRARRRVNMALYNGDSTLVSDCINGLQYYIENNSGSDHTIDLRGAAPTESTFQQVGELIMANEGDPNGTNVYCSPGGMTTINQILSNVTATASAQRYLQGTVGPNGEIPLGSHVPRIDSGFGMLQPRVDKFIAELYESRKVPMIPTSSDPATLQEGKTSTRAPDTPSFAAAPNGVATTGSQWAASGTRSVGTYYYRVAAGNKYGLSAAATAAAASGTSVAGQAITVTITPAATSAYPATYYEIYSSTSTSDYNATTNPFYLIGRVADSGSATTAWNDLNTNLPGYTRYFIVDMTSVGEYRSFTMKQLAPIYSEEYAKIGPYRWGTVNYYLTTVPYAARRYVQVINVPITAQTKSDYLAI